VCSPKGQALSPHKYEFQVTAWLLLQGYPGMPGSRGKGKGGEAGKEPSTRSRGLYMHLAG